MEKWTEAGALKPSLRGEPTMSLSDELLSLNSSVEDFSVECFLDLSEEHLLAHGGDDEEEEEEGQGIGPLCSSREEQEEADNSSGSEPFLLDQLPLPDMAELEWVSRVVDDCSSPELSLLFTERKAQGATQRWVHHNRKPCFSFRVPVKPRTKRSRNAKASNPVLPSLSPISGSPLLTSPIPRWASQRKKKAEAGEHEEAMFQRRCSHCGVNNTPQWRTGPLGPKTLCNACGVRYKSGRLCPEYRPASSPTFSSEMHSNVHRKVLELRKEKESGAGAANQTESNSAGRETS